MLMEYTRADDNGLDQELQGNRRCNSPAKDRASLGPTPGGLESTPNIASPVPLQLLVKSVTTAF
jgi:hypothetical protein